MEEKPPDPSPNDPYQMVRHPFAQLRECLATQRCCLAFLPFLPGAREETELRRKVKQSEISCQLVKKNLSGRSLVSRSSNPKSSSASRSESFPLSPNGIVFLERSPDPAVIKLPSIWSFTATVYWNCWELHVSFIVIFLVPSLSNFPDHFRSSESQDASFLRLP